MNAVEPPRPECTPQAEPFLHGLARGELLLPRCTDCGTVTHPGASPCRRCLGRTFEWVVASGRGEVFSYVIIARSFHPAFEAPYAVCVVELEEGPRLVAHVTGVDDAELEVGLAVAVDFAASGEAGVPLRFSPRGTDSGCSASEDDAARGA